MKQTSCKWKFGRSLALIAICTAGTAVADAQQPTASVVLDPTHQTGGAIPQRFMGISIEWTLIERYMNPNAQPAFVNLLRNWDSGFVRVGGGSQDSTPYSASAPNTVIGTCHGMPATNSRLTAPPNANLPTSPKKL